MGWCLTEDYVTEISADVREAVAHRMPVLIRVRDDALNKSRLFYFYFTKNTGV